MTKTNHIFFYSHKNGKFACFSNFYTSPVVLNDRTWPTVEHYFQAMKTSDELIQETIRKEKSPFKAKSLGRKVNLKSDWEEIKNDVMLKALMAKFTQHKDLREILLSTNDAELHEESPYDEYWGCKGQDILGKLLMQVREALYKTLA
ncbi:MAG: NADAR family protein [Planctomycetes bacterium]|nr:NADAR family protein [Planctomycetota bacterium]